MWPWRLKITQPLQNSCILPLCVNHHPLVQKLFYFLVWSNSSNSVFTQARESWEDGARVLPLVISLEGRLCCILLLCFCCSVAMLMLCWCCAVAMPLHIACCKTKPTWSLHNTCHRCNMELSQFKHGIVTWICQSYYMFSPITKQNQGEVWPRLWS